MKNDFEQLEEVPEWNTYLDSLREILKKMLNWKTAGHGGIYGFWCKNFKSIRDILVRQLSKCLQEASILEWMTKFGWLVCFTAYQLFWVT